jgi:hypothetical protein
MSARLLLAGACLAALLAGCGGVAVEDAAPPSRTAGAVVVAPPDE